MEQNLINGISLLGVAIAVASLIERASGTSQIGLGLSSALIFLMAVFEINFGKKK